MSKLSDKIKAETKSEHVKPEKGDKNPYIRPKHRAIFERMKQGETITGAMIAMSYKPTMVDNPHLVTKTKSWQALMEEQLPEDHVAMRHRELLDARKYRTVTTGRGKDRKEERVDDGVDPVVMKAVELAYKLRGRTMGDATPTERPNVYNIFYNPTVRASTRAFEDALKQTIAYEVDRPSDVDTQDNGAQATEQVHQDDGTSGAGSVDTRTAEDVRDPQGAGDTGAE